MKEITVSELKELMDAKAEFQLIDVREPAEFEEANLDGILIPLQTIPQNVEKIAKDKQVVVHCRSGKRSANAIAFLESNYGFDNLYNLVGGILAWRDEIDPDMDVH
ncbi:MAG: rhodanese-like domain-containing protein [Cytophagaceae bacterium]